MQRAQPGINWEPEIVAKIKKNQCSDLELFKVINHISERPEFKLIGKTGCVPDMQDLKDEIMTDAHHSRYSIHPSTKMCQNF